MDLAGKTVLLTGSDGGLGPSIARSLAERGARLVLAERPGAEAHELAAELKAGGVESWAVSADLSRAGGAKELILAATEVAGPPDVLVNNAGLELIGAFTSHTEEELERITHVNLVAPAELTRLLIPGMIDRGGGWVVNLGSLAGKVASAYSTSYTATKHGLVGLTHSLRAEYAGAPVGFSVVCPGFVRDVGMYGRHEDAVPPPSMLGTIPPERVGDAVVKAIEKEKPEMIVNERPIKPVIALTSVAPRFGTLISRRSGVDELWRRVGERKGRL